MFITGSSQNDNKRYKVASSAIFTTVIIACIGCWIISYIYSIGFPVYNEVSTSLLWDIICQVLSIKIFTYLIGAILLIGGALLLNRISYTLALIREKTSLPFLFYILIISTTTYFFPLKATSLGAFCLILAIYELFTFYHNTECKSKSYNIGLLIGIGSLFWIHILWFIPLFWYGMYNLRNLSFRTFMSSFLGVSTVYWFLFGWCVWNNNFTSFSLYFPSLFKYRFLEITGIEIEDWIYILFIISLTTVSSINIIAHKYKEVLRTRQYLYFLIIMSFWSFFLFFIYEQSSEEFLQIACVPASILLAHLFTVVRSRIILGLFHFTLLLFIILFIIQIWNFL